MAVHKRCGDMSAGFSSLAVVAILGALFSAIFGFVSNWLRDRQERQRRIVGEFESICDNYMEIVAKYWSSPVDGGNRRTMQPLAGQINALGLLLSRFIIENFSSNANVRMAFGSVRRVITGGDFGNNNRDADQKRLMMSIAAIVELRFAARK